MAELDQPPVLIQTVIYVNSPDDRYLLIHKDANRSHDPYAGQWNGLGGGVFPPEDPITGGLRELQQEGGIWVPRNRVQFGGTVQVQNVFKGRYVQLNVLYVQDYDGPVNEQCREGKLEWIAKDLVVGLHSSPSDKRIAELVLAKAFPFFGTITKTNDKVSYFIEPL